MLKHNHKNENIFTLLSIKLLNNNQWQLLSNTSHSNLFRNLETHRLFELVHLPSWIKSHNEQVDLKHCWDHFSGAVEIDEDIEINEIFMSVFSVGGQYYLCEKSVMNLCGKISNEKTIGSMTKQREAEIINTFAPILEALSQNLIPPSYALTSESIRIDTNQTIRLSHPMFSSASPIQYSNHSKSHSKFHFQCNTLARTIMMCFMQTSEIHEMTEENIKIICEILMKKGCSWILVGVIIGLMGMSYGKWNVPQKIDEKINDWEFWKDVVFGICPQLFIGESNSAMRNFLERACDDETEEDSQKTNFHKLPSCLSLSELSKPHKYRSGKRLKVTPDRYDKPKTHVFSELLLEMGGNKFEGNEWVDI